MADKNEYKEQMSRCQVKVTRTGRMPHYALKKEHMEQCIRVKVSEASEKCLAFLAQSVTPFLPPLTK